MLSLYIAIILLVVGQLSFHVHACVRNRIAASMPYASALKDCMSSLAPSASPLPRAYSCSPSIIHPKDPYPCACPPSDTMYIFSFERMACASRRWC